MKSIRFHIDLPLPWSTVMLHKDMGPESPVRTDLIYRAAGESPPGAQAGGELWFPPGTPDPADGDYLYLNPRLTVEERGEDSLVLDSGSGHWLMVDGRHRAFLDSIRKPVSCGMISWNRFFSPAYSRRFIRFCLARNILCLEQYPALYFPAPHHPPPPPGNIGMLFGDREDRVSLEESGGVISMPLTDEDLITAAGPCHACDSLFGDFTMKARPGLYRSRRGEKTLVVDGDSASWAVIPAPYEAMLDALGEEQHFSLLAARFPSIEPSRLLKIADSMYSHGFISLNGRDFFPPPDLMWRPLDDAPGYPRSFYLHLTDACNFRCDYCYAKAEGKGRSMSVKTARAAIEKIVSDTPYDDIFVEFHGGEPLLQKKVIYAAVERGLEVAGKQGKRIHFSLQTSGALLDEDVLLRAREHKVRIGISLDGPLELHDRYRKGPGGTGTFHQVWSRIQAAWRMGIEPGFMGVVHERGDYMKAYEFFVSSGILCFKLNYAAALGRASSALEFQRTRAADLAHGALDMLDAAVLFNRRSPVPVKIYDFNLYLAALAGKKREYMCLRSPCGAGRSLLAIGTGGELYPCEEMSTYPEFACGSIFSERPLTCMVDESEAIRRMRERRVERFEPCSACPWRYFCAGKCLHKAFHCHGEIMHEDPMCRFYSTLFEELIWRIDRDRGVFSLV